MVSAAESPTTLARDNGSLTRAVPGPFTCRYLGGAAASGRGLWCWIGKFTGREKPDTRPEHARASAMPYACG